MIVKKLNEDIFAAFMNHDFEIMVQGCNCHHVQGSGIAGIIRHRYPEVYQADVEQSVKGDPNKLGTYTIANTIDGKVINAYTQFDFGTEKRHADYDAIAKVFRKINDDFSGKDVTFGIPKIGAGLAGGEWDIIEKLINDNTPDIDIIYYYI